jgi:bifunctional non-homologous end joining protein LigD
MPAALSPELATLVAAPPTAGRWRYEVKFDGYRILARVEPADVRLLTRNGNDWTGKLQPIAAALRSLALPPCWLDGEIVVLDARGASDFGALQRAFDGGAERIRYFVFDLPWCAGHDLRGVALEERRAVLERLLAGARAPIAWSRDVDADAGDLLRRACRLHLEGLIGKRLGSRYASGRTRDWIKLKCTLRQEFVIGGYTDPQGGRTGIGALLLGIHDDAGLLRYAGNVGTGFDTRTLADLRRRLDAIAAPQTPFHELPRSVRGHWAAPQLVAEVSFAEWTRDGKVRQAVFHGLRSDKPARAIGIERAAEPPRAPDPPELDAPPARRDASKRTPRSTREPNHRGPTPALPARLRITHPERVIDRSTGCTKQDIVDHYLRAAPRILPHLAGRPVALVRAPAGVQGQHFFQKHVGSLHIADIVELPVALDPGHPPLLEIASFTALISAAQMNVVEFHTWNATARNIEKPDRMTFDLDPGEGVAWPEMVEAARLTRTLLESLGLKPFLKTSGGKGLHVLVPLKPADGWDAVKDFSRSIVERLAQARPDRVVARSGARNRIGRIFVDYLRNGRGATTVAAWSARARPGLGVSVPCDWNELDGLEGGDHWTIASVHERLEAATDPRLGWAEARRGLGAARRALARAPPLA